MSRAGYGCWRRLCRGLLRGLWRARLDRGGGLLDIPRSVKAWIRVDSMLWHVRRRGLWRGSLPAGGFGCRDGGRGDNRPMLGHLQWFHAIIIISLLIMDRKREETYAGSQKGQHLIHQLIIRELSSQHDRAQNISLYFLCINFV